MVNDSMSDSHDLIQKDEIPDEEAARMSFTGHLGELRTRMVHTTIVVGILFFVGLSFSDQIMTYIKDLVDTNLDLIVEQENKLSGESKQGINQGLSQSNTSLEFAVELDSVQLNDLQNQLNNDDTKKVTLRAKVNDIEPLLDIILGKVQEHSLDQVLNKKKKGLEWITLTPLESFMVKIKIALYTAIALGVPYIVYQICAFVFPGLKPKEKYVIRFALLASFSLALMGILTALFIVFPVVFPQLLKFAPDWVGSFLQLEKTMTFIFKVVLGFGLAFQFPIVILVAVYLDFVSPKDLREHRKIAIVVILIVAAILTPPDPATLFLMSAPLLLLYEISILLSYFIIRRRDDDEEEVA